MRVEVIVNPTAGGPAVREAEALMDILRRQGIFVRLRGTRFRGHAQGLAAEAASQNVDRLVVAGGDGTINEVINGLAGATTPLAIIPAGTANVLAQELAWPRRVDRIAAAVLAGKTRRVSLGAVNDRRFALMASIGLDAEVVARINPKLKRRFGKLAYAASALRQLLVRRPQLFDVEIDGRTERVAAAIAAKARHYGGAFVVAPQARLDRPVFQLVLARDPGRLAHLRYAVALGRGGLHRATGIEIREASKLRFVGPVGMPVQADGDAVGAMPATIEILPDALTLIDASAGGVV